MSRSSTAIPTLTASAERRPALSDELIVQRLQVAVRVASCGATGCRVRDLERVQERLHGRGVLGLRARDIGEDARVVLRAENLVDVLGELLLLAHVLEVGGLVGRQWRAGLRFGVDGRGGGALAAVRRAALCAGVTGPDLDGRDRGDDESGDPNAGDDRQELTSHPVTPHEG